MSETTHAEESIAPESQQSLPGTPGARASSLLADENVSVESEVITAHETPQADQEVEDLPKPCSSTPARPPQRPPNIIRLWGAEMAALCISTGALCAIVGVVLPYQNKAIPNWPSSISINAAISILTVILRAGLAVVTAEALSQHKWTWFKEERRLIDIVTLDKATRGPGGSLKLLFSRSCSFKTAIGAIIIVFTAATGPFIQQLVRYNSCQLPSVEANATIARQGLYYDVGSYFDTAFHPTLSMQSSINGGLFTGHSITVPALCTSGICSFESAYHTVGFGSECRDITDQMNFTILEKERPGTTNLGVFQYTLPHNFTVMNNYSDKEWGRNLVYATARTESERHRFIFVNDRWGPESQANCSASETKDPWTSWKCKGYGAAECAVLPCVYSYTASVSEGRTAELLLGKTSEWGHDKDRTVSMLHVPCLNNEQRQILDAGGYNISTAAEWLPYNRPLSIVTGRWSHVEKDVIADDSLDQIPPQCLYQVEANVISSIDNWLGKLFEGNVTSDGSSDSENGPAPLFRLYNDANASFALVEEIFNDIAAGITADIRLSGNHIYDAFWQTPKNISDALSVNNQPAQGVALEANTCVEVRWLWLIFPAALIVLTVAFFVLTILDTSFNAANPAYAPSADTRKSGPVTTFWRPAGIWKSSILPLMYHGLEDGRLRSDDPAAMLPVRSMEDAARSTKVQIGHTDGGWKFIKRD